MDRSQRKPFWLALSAALMFAFPTPVSSHDDPDNDGLIDGGGNPSKDCQSKFQTGIELNYPAPPKKKQKELACIDGDVACDADGSVNGSCTMNVGLCLADDDDAVCTPGGVPTGGVVIKQKASAPNPDFTALQAEVDTLIGAGLPCANPGSPPGNCFQCTASQVPITIDLAVKKGKKKLRVKTTSEPFGPKNKPLKDSDKLKMRCIECEADSAFEHINNIVFKASCAFSAACHTGVSPAGGMNLNSDEVGLSGVHAALITDDPVASGALALGMRRVLPSDPDLETLSSSLLIEKLRNTQSELDLICTDGGQSADCLGQEMPPGVDVFSTGKVELLKTWIAAGAPLTGWPAGATCGEPEDVWSPATPLDPPAPGTGFQIHWTPPVGFDVPPGTEFEGCQWIEIPASVTETTYVTAFEIRANSGTHHIIAYDDIPDGGPAAVPTAFDSDDALCNEQFGLKSFQVASQESEFLFSLPPNVSWTVEPGKVYGINMHYTNPFNIPIYPEVWINFIGTTTPTAKAAGLSFPGDSLFNIPPYTASEGNLMSFGPGGGANGACYWNISSHMHRRGTEVKGWLEAPSSWNDHTDLFYFSNDWDHPLDLLPSPRIYRAPGQQTYFQCQWDNGVLNDVTRRCVPSSGPACDANNPYICFSNDDCGAGTTGVCDVCALDFGFLSEDEMCFFPSFYYAADPGPDPCPY
jgi:hypothetical protein